MNYAFTLDSVFKLVPPNKTQNPLDKPVCFTHANVLLSYVHETVFAWKPAFQDFMAWDDSLCANVISKRMLWVRRLVSL